MGLEILHGLSTGYTINIATSSMELATDLIMELEKEGGSKKNKYSVTRKER